MCCPLSFYSSIISLYVNNCLICIFYFFISQVTLCSMTEQPLSNSILLWVGFEVLMWCFSFKITLRRRVTYMLQKQDIVFQDFLSQSVNQRDRTDWCMHSITRLWECVALKNQQHTRFSTHSTKTPNTGELRGK